MSSGTALFLQRMKGHETDDGRDDLGVINCKWILKLLPVVEEASREEEEEGEEVGVDHEDEVAHPSGHCCLAQGGEALLQELDHPHRQDYPRRARECHSSPRVSCLHRKRFAPSEPSRSRSELVSAILGLMNCEPQNSRTVGCYAAI